MCVAPSTVASVKVCAGRRAPSIFTAPPNLTLKEIKTASETMALVVQRLPGLHILERIVWVSFDLPRQFIVTLLDLLPDLRRLSLRGLKRLALVNAGVDAARIVNHVVPQTLSYPTALLHHFQLPTSVFTQA
jgi:hypothetical protein